MSDGQIQLYRRQYIRRYSTRTDATNMIAFISNSTHTWSFRMVGVGVDSCGRQPADQSILLAGTFLAPINRCPFSKPDSFLPFSVGPQLWREGESVSFSSVPPWVEPRRTHDHTLLSPWKLRPPSGTGGPGMPLDTDFPLQHLLRLGRCGEGTVTLLCTGTSRIRAQNLKLPVVRFLQCKWK
jgi:hypothetical protein